MHFNTETVDVVSNTKGQMSGILLRKLDTGEESVLEAKGLFYGIGHSPNSQLLEGQVELDSSGYLLVEEGTSKTSVEGVFAAGDVQVILSRVIIFISSVFNLSRIYWVRYLGGTINPVDISQQGFMSITYQKKKKKKKKLSIYVSKQWK